MKKIQLLQVDCSVANLVSCWFGGSVCMQARMCRTRGGLPWRKGKWVLSSEGSSNSILRVQRKMPLAETVSAFPQINNLNVWEQQLTYTGGLSTRKAKVPWRRETKVCVRYTWNGVCLPSGQFQVSSVHKYLETISFSHSLVISFLKQRC